MKNTIQKDSASPPSQDFTEVELGSRDPQHARDTSMISTYATSSLDPEGDDEKKSLIGGKLKTNRRKAVIFANLMAIAMWVYSVGAKVVMHDADVEAIDLCLIQTFVAFVCSGTLAVATGQSFHVPIEDRRTLTYRSLFGTITINAYLVSVYLVPISLAQIIYNTTPFWASLLSWHLLGERMMCIELVAMCLSFVGIMMIATSKPEDIPSEQAAENQEAEERTQAIVHQASAFAKAFGCFMVLIASWAVAVVGV
jgi:drug/metabolite transporter (DMT)-like permease